MEQVALSTVRSGFVPHRVATPDQAHVVHLGPNGGPGVLLLHELMGLTDETFELAEAITAAGFRVAVPHLFGPAGGDGSMPAGSAGLIGRCIAREMSLLARNQPRKGTEWLAEAASWLGTHTTSPRGVAVIGMCATGAFAMAAVLDPQVKAVVASQAAFPMLRPGSWAIPGGDEQLGSGDKGVMTLRFRRDCKSAKRRVERLPDLVGGEPPTHRREGPASPDPKAAPSVRGIDVSEGGRLHVVWADGRGHSVLTASRVDRAVVEVAAFLRKNLHPAA
ncbi:dienelactone hydrolase family protein [Microbacterium sp. 2FI]|uniref:dienelactone hydrolase family protein n=1 Tax=Microbacterium sp. 2FI TaxID=2502193 RepID=UPI0010F63054|nr:dienelactone hydrolase family protein [Microbacterium sp. 2FI]